MSDIQWLTVLIPALPLAAAVIIALLGKAVLGRFSHLPAALAVGAAAVLSMILVAKVAEQADVHHEGSIGYTSEEVRLWTWAEVDDAMTPADRSGGVAWDIGITLRADSLSAMMLAMVTFISLLVIIYAAGYMHGDEGYWRFFAYVSLFVFSMCMLVTAANFLLLYVFWEAVGLCSYLLIGFWYREAGGQRPPPKRRSLVNRIGDFGFALGVFLIWCTFGTLNFYDGRR